MNSHIVKSCGPALERVLVHLRDNPEVPCLVHCTGASLSSCCTGKCLTPTVPAGKDRAGMLAGMVLMVSISLCPAPEVIDGKYRFWAYVKRTS